MFLLILILLKTPFAYLTASKIELEGKGIPRFHCVKICIKILLNTHLNLATLVLKREQTNLT